MYYLVFIAGLPQGQEKLRKITKVRKSQVKIGVFEKRQKKSINLTKKNISFVSLHFPGT